MLGDHAPLDQVELLRLSPKFNGYGFWVLNVKLGLV